MPLLPALLIDLVTILQSASPANTIRDPKYTARVIIADMCGIDRASQLAHPDQPIPNTHADRARNAATRHAGGEPLSRIRGTARFYDMDFNLSPDTLDPRPETEMIVRMVLQLVLPLKGGGALRSRSMDGGGDIIFVLSTDLIKRGLIRPHHLRGKSVRCPITNRTIILRRF